MFSDKIKLVQKDWLLEAECFLPTTDFGGSFVRIDCCNRKSPVKRHMVTVEVNGPFKWLRNSRSVISTESDFR